MISVIICTYNRAKYIYGVLESIAKGDYPAGKYEIVLVDNNCTDNTKAEVERFCNNYPDVSLHYFVESNQGLSYARNRGIMEAEGDILVFLDDDAFPNEAFLTTIASQMALHNEVDCFGGKITPVFEGGNVPNWLCRWSLSWVSGLDMGERFKPFTKGYPIGANMGFRKSVFDECGVFDTNLGRSKGNLIGGEEKDLFSRIKNSGKGIFFFPGIEVKHIIPQSRTTKEYVSNLGQGVGMSERIRCKSKGFAAYLKRSFSEIIKWGETLVLWLVYLLRLKPACGNMLVRFRWNVSKKLVEIGPKN